MDIFFENGLKNFIFTLLPVLVETEAVRDFMDISAPRKYQKQRNYFIWYIICLTSLYVMEYIAPTYLAEYIVFILFVFLSIKSLYKAGVVRALLIAFGMTFAKVVFEQIFSVHLLEIIGIDIAVQDKTAIYTFFMNMAPKTTLMLLLRITRGMVGYCRIKGLKWKDIGFALLVMLVFMRMFWLIFSASLHTGEISAWNAYFLTGLLILNISMFHMMNRLQEYYKHEIELREMNSHMRVEMDNILAVKETHAKIRRISHGITNHLFAIETLLRNRQYEEAEQYLAKVNQTVEQDMLPIHTNNVVIDAILNQKYTLASSKNIKMHFDIQDLQKCKVHEITMVTLLSHGLNNAIEACEQVRGDKIIELQIFSQKE